MYHDDIQETAKENDNFRQVIYTGKHTQLVLMSLGVGEDIGEETHSDVDQIFFIADGDGEAVVGNETFGIDKHDVVFIPAGIQHNVKNVGDKELKIYTVYGPPNHKDGTIHRTKADAMKDEEDHV